MLFVASRGIPISGFGVGIWESSLAPRWTFRLVKTPLE
jgi:hypothetical protein